MTKDNINKLFRGYIHNNITLSQKDKELASSIYEQIKNVLGKENCFQTGSYARFTAIRPIHDLDIINIIGDWDDSSHNPSEALETLKNNLNENFINPTDFDFEIDLQSHSVTICFKENNLEIISVDIVPSYINGFNEFHQDMYMVPELINKKHALRKKYYQDLNDNGIEMSWVISDPRGYVQVASNINNLNDDFRKTVKFIKSWKDACKKENEKFKLKSFHIEQIITNYFVNNNNLTIFDAIFKFFTNIRTLIDHPQITDRADSRVFIDDYLIEQDFNKELVLTASDQFLIRLENLDDLKDIAILFEETLFYKRHSLTEAYLFDNKIPVFLNENLDLKIIGRIRTAPGFRFEYECPVGVKKITTKNNLKFEIIKDTTDADLFRWKVQNDFRADETRGEITDNHTLLNPETTRYPGKHYVEAYAIKNNICIARDRINIFI